MMSIIHYTPRIAVTALASCASLFLLALTIPALSAQNKGTPIASTGVPAPMLYDVGDPVSLGYPCDLSHAGIPYYNMSSGVARPISVCDGTNWIQAATPIAPPVAAVANGDGTITFTKADGTTWSSTGSLRGPAGSASTVPGPQGNPGTSGTNATNPAFTASSSPLASGASPTVSLTGTYPNLSLALGIPSGASGNNGTNGSNGTAATAAVGAVTSLACSATPTVTNTGTSAAAVFSFGVPACQDLVGNGTIPAATLLVAGCSATATIAVTGAIIGHRVDVMTTSGALPLTNSYLVGSVTSANTVTVQQCATLALTMPSVAVRVSVGP